ncbi:PREDICTED: F-box only protein 12-like [Camelina sativa]|uniref:F-box only protein 12-like n=1 Tax=Camelina sativa TaxID=90675 RepID=A0ABM0V6Q8_CAMSA|nr:PREDICTED: F-box only protein 12-like [Camelina sativa]
MGTCDYMACSDLGHYVLTLRGGELRWRKIHCPFSHAPMCERVCINGVLYYLSLRSHDLSYVVIFFDVRSESFKLVNTECRFNCPFHILVSYKGKLCGIRLDYDDGYYSGGLLLQLSMWILEDVDKQEWSKHVYSLPVESDVVKFDRKLSVSGMTATGDIVLSMIYASKPFYVFYFNPGKNTLKIVEILGVGADSDYRVYAFVDYVEDLSVNGAMQLDSSVPLHYNAEASIVV